EGKLIPARNSPAHRADAAKPHFAGALGERFFPSRGEQEADNQKADQGAQKRANKDGQKSAAKPQERAHHKHHFHVAKAHAIAVANDFVEPGRKPEQTAAQDGAEDSVEHPGRPAGKHYVIVQQQGCYAIDWRNIGRKDQAQSDAEPVDDIGKNPFAEIGYDQNYQQTTERDPLESWQGKPKTKVAGDE